MSSSTQLDASSNSASHPSPSVVLLPRITPRPTKVGLVAGGLGAYWPQFPDLLPQLSARRARCRERMRELDCDVVDVGFISDAQEGAVAAEKLRAAGCDLIVGFLTTYMTATMLLPVAQRSGAPVLLINLQPTEVDGPRDLRHRPVAGLLRRLPAAGDGQRLPPRRHRLPVGVRLPRGRAGLGARSPAGSRRPACAAPSGAGRHGLMGHLYPGMLDVATDLTLVPVQPRRPHRGAGVRRPAGTGGEGDRRRGRRADRPGPRGLRAGRHASSRTTSPGPPGSRSGSTGWSTTSPSTAWPTTTAASTVRCTSGSAPA